MNFDWKTMGGLAIIGSLIAAWDKVKGFLHQVRSVFVVTYTFGYYVHAKVHIVRWMNENLRVIRLGDRNFYFTTLQGVDKSTEHICVFNRMNHGKFLAFYGCVPIYVRMDQHGIMDLTFVRGTFPWREMIKAVQVSGDIPVTRDVCSRFYIEHMWGELGSVKGIEVIDKADGKAQKEPMAEDGVTYMSIYHGMHQLMSGNGENLGWRNDRADQMDWLGRLYLDVAQTKAVEEVEFWVQSKEWYKKRKISWKRSLLLHGLPGTGKSSLAYALAWKFDLPLMVLHLDTMTDKDLHQKWWGTNEAKIYLIEDIDAVFEGRKNLFKTEMNNALSFECLLNVIDGVDQSEGTLLIISTNNLEKLDKALLRPGRVDTMVEFGKLDYEGKKFIAKQILLDLKKKDIEEFVDKRCGNGLTGAEMKEKCIKEALRRHWGYTDIKKLKKVC